MDRGHRPPANRVMALAAAIALCGTLIGRRVAGADRSGTHLYASRSRPTGAGKQHPIDCVGALMIAAGAQEHLGPGTFMSASALCNFVFRRPLSLCCSDEFGAIRQAQRQRCFRARARGNPVMRSLWGISFALYPTPEWADRVAQQVHSPALSFLGTSTPDELFQALQGEAIENGLLNRFLVLRSDMRARDMEPQIPSGQVPADLAMQCRRLYRWHGTDAELIDIKRPVEQQVTQLPWAGKPAEKEYLDFARMVDDRIDQDPALRPFLLARPKPPSALPPSGQPGAPSDRNSHRRGCALGRGHCLDRRAAAVRRCPKRHPGHRTRQMGRAADQLRSRPEPDR